MDYRRGALVALVLLLVFAPVGVGVASAQRVSGGGTVVVAEGETVDGLQTAAGSVIVRGTVEGDLNAIAGDVRIAESGRVTGKVAVLSGNLQVDGRVGSVAGAMGEFTLNSGGVVDGDVEVAAGTVVIAGEVGGDARLGAEQVTITESGSVGGDLEYDAQQFTNRGSVAGSISQVDDVSGFGPVLPTGLFAGYWFLVRLFVGAILLAALPAFADRVSERVTSDPARTGLVGLATLLAVPVALLLLLVTVIGIPISLGSLFGFLVLAWVATIYGSYVVGVWLLDQADVTNRWAALVVGLVAWLLLDYVPILGGLARLVIFLLALGAIAGEAADRVRRSRGRGPVATTAAGPEEGTEAGSEGVTDAS